MTKTTRTTYFDAARAHLARMGFKKRTGDVFTLDLAPGVLGWLGLNRATQHRGPGEVEVSPVVGVRFQEVERLVAECRGEALHAYQPPTISSPLGYLMPNKKYMAWLFTPGGSEEVSARMADAVAAHGVPFMRSVVDIGDLRRRLHDRYGFEHQLVYRRPVAALLAADLGQARALLDDTVAAMGARTDLAAADFRRFAEALRDRLPPL